MEGAVSSTSQTGDRHSGGRARSKDGRHLNLACLAVLGVGLNTPSNEVEIVGVGRYAIASTPLAPPANRAPMAASEVILPAPINAIPTRFGLVVGFLCARNPLLYLHQSSTWVLSTHHTYC